MRVTTDYRQNTEKPQSLGDLSHGSPFYYATDSFEEAVKENLFWMVVKTQPEKKDRVTCVHIDTGQLVERDTDHQVYQVNANLNVIPQTPGFSNP